jgi:hypothetical protein
MKPVIGLWEAGVNTIKSPLSWTVTLAFDSKAARASLVGPRGVNPQIINPANPTRTMTPMMMRATFTLFSILPQRDLVV